MIRSIEGLRFADPAASSFSLGGEWLRRHWLSIFGSVLMILLGLLLIGLAVDLHVWDLKDWRLFLMTLPLGLAIVAIYGRLIRAALRHPLRSLAKTPDARRFVRGEIVSVQWTWNDFGWGRHPQATLRFSDAQGQSHPFVEDFSMGAWLSFAAYGDLKEPVPVWILYSAQDAQQATFVGLQQEWAEEKLAGSGAAKLSFWKAVLAVLVMGALTVGILIFSYNMGWMQ